MGPAGFALGLHTNLEHASARSKYIYTRRAAGLSIYIQQFLTALIAPGNRPYKCSTCGQGFVHRQALKQHLMKNHLNEQVGRILNSTAAPAGYSPSQVGHSALIIPFS